MNAAIVIRPLKPDDVVNVVAIICEANVVVARQFGITCENNPKHPSFYTPEWLASDIAKGEQYFVAQQHKRIIACVAFEQPRPGTAYLNRLSVLPSYQRQGVGQALVGHIVKEARRLSVATISIGIIATHVQLKSWYIRLGFVEGETKAISHLPFDVTYLRLSV